MKIPLHFRINIVKHSNLKIIITVLVIVVSLTCNQFKIFHFSGKLIKMTKPRNKLTNEAKRQAERERRRRIRDDQVKPWVQLSKKDKKKLRF